MCIRDRLILLNLLIGVVAAANQRVNAKAEKVALYERAKYILEKEQIAFASFEHLPDSEIGAAVRRSPLQAFVARAAKRGLVPGAVVRLFGEGYKYSELFPRHLHVLKHPDSGGGGANNSERELIASLNKSFGR